MFTHDEGEMIKLLDQISSQLLFHHVPLWRSMKHLNSSIRAMTMDMCPSSEDGRIRSKSEIVIDGDTMKKKKIIIYI